MAKAPKKRVRKKKVVRKKDDPSRLTDKYGRLKFMKTSKYYKEIQGED